MKIVVFSDSHGITAPMQAAMEQNQDAKLFIHLGDGVDEFVRLMNNCCPGREFWYVRGNCDYSSTQESTAVSWVKDVKVLFTHGHHWNVKYDLDELKQEAMEKQARLVLYGHTHCSHISHEDGMYIMNPGSISCPRDGWCPTYGIIELHGKSIRCSIIRMEEFRGY